MRDTKCLVVRATDGDLDAYGEIVQRFQDMAHSYACSILGDFQLAEDTVQEAFVDAYRQLPALREPRAFPGWFRRIVFKHCDRLTRRTRVATVSLDVAEEMTAGKPGPAEVAKARELQQKVMAAIRSLPKTEQEVITLYYVDDRSQKDISGILGIPVTTVNNRLYASRKRLRRRMWQTYEEEFAEKVRENMDTAEDWSK